jgi:23S rRNA pseudouridine1911/1915/1917 synthase
MTKHNQPAAANRPLLDWLLQKYPATPKKRARQWIQAGRVRVNGVVVRRPQQVVPDSAAIELLDRHAQTLDCGPTGLPIHPRVVLLHLDAALAVVNKAPSLLSVPAENYELSALTILTDFLAGKLRAVRIAHSIPPAYRNLKALPVHRLDQYTSGVFCMAMNPVARAKLINQLQAHTMQRQYVAYVEGRPQSPKGTWRDWLKLSDDELRQFVVPSSSRASVRRAGENAARSAAAAPLEAITHYEVVAEFAGVTKLRLHLETGRRHQIRVQAAHAGLPLVGDRLYNPQGKMAFDRQALHAETLNLEHPETGQRMTFTAPLPKDLQQLEAKLRPGRSKNIQQDSRLP